MSDRNLTTSTYRVFGHVEKGTVCRVCERDVTDGRAKYCSDYCRNLAKGVMAMLNWPSVRRRIRDRDDNTCQLCGFKGKWIDRGREHIQSIIYDEHLPEQPDAPSMLLMGKGEITDEEYEDWKIRNKAWSMRRDQLLERYGDPDDHYENRLEVDHITPISEGGHPFDPGNLWTLCSDCHEEKTAKEASERAERRTPSRPDIETELADFVADGGQSAFTEGDDE